MSGLMPVLPKDDLSFWVGKLMHKRLPSTLRKASIEAFAKYYQINIEEAEKPLDDYLSIGDFFTRKLKPGVRPIGDGLTHPCDSKVLEAGHISGGTLTQVKGISYSLGDLLGDFDLAKSYETGAYLTYYLCPTDYHRVHLPFDGVLEKIRHIPGKFWPVNHWSVKSIRDLYAINERMVMKFDTYTLVMVAATNVGSIQLSVDSEFDSTRRKKGRKVIEKTFETKKRFSKGDEAGLFSMGSSVVLVLSPDLVKNQNLSPERLTELKGQTVKVGEAFC